MRRSIDDLAEDLTDRLDDADVEDALAMLLDQAERSRLDPFEFFEFVMREQVTGANIQLAAHQRVAIDFIEKHDRVVLMLPAGHSKSWMLRGMTMRLLGEDPTSRGAFVSATQEQAADSVAFVRDYIESSNELRMVFPELRRSQRAIDPWQRDRFFVHRPPGNPTASLAAYGFDSNRMPGIRLNWIVVDDILTQANAATKDQRDKVCDWFFSTVERRLEKVRGRAKVIVSNTAWHPDDLPHRLEKAGWPTLRMSIDGDIEIRTPDEDRGAGVWVRDDWGFEDRIAHEIRPTTSKPDEIRVRLTAHDPDPDNLQTLWPGKVSVAERDVLRAGTPAHIFNKVYRQVCRDDDTAKCQIEWVEKCKKKARELGLFSFMSKPRGDERVIVMGADFAIGEGEAHDDTAIVTVGVLGDGTRVWLDGEAGKFSGPIVRDKLGTRAKRYDAMVMVENNAAQKWAQQFLREKYPDVPVRGFTTGRAKADPFRGVESFFIEIEQGLWAFPNNSRGVCPPIVQRLIDACLYYSAEKHTDDVLMAIYMAREMIKKMGIASGGAVIQVGGGVAKVVDAVMSR